MGGCPGPAGVDALRWWRRMARDPLRTHVELANRYGDAARLPLRGGRAYHVLTRPEHAEHILVSHHDNYTKTFTIRTLRAFLGDGLLTSEGSVWQRHRRLVQPVLAHRRVAASAPAMREAARRRAACWRDDTVLDAAAEMRAITLDVVGRVLFGTDLSAAAGWVGPALTALQRGALVTAFLPLRSPDAVRTLAGVLPGVGAAADRLDDLVRRLIEGSRQAADGEPAGLVGLLVAARLDDGELRDEVMTLLLAGHETTAATLTWALVLLSRHPEVRARLEAEVDEVLSGGEPDAGDVERLPWTRAVVSETLRLFPPAWRLTRDALGDDDIGGVPVRAGSTVTVPPYLVHRCPDVWPRPESFRPQRFLTPVDLPRCAYLPFGAGRRMCVGAGFATLEAVLVLATIARGYRLDLDPAAPPRLRAEVTLRPAGPVPMRVRRRS